MEALILAIAQLCMMPAGNTDQTYHNGLVAEQKACHKYYADCLLAGDLSHGDVARAKSLTKCISDRK